MCILDQVGLDVITTLELKTGPYFYPRSSLKPKFGKSIYRYDIWRSTSQKTNLLMSKLSFWQPKIKIMLKSFISKWLVFHKNEILMEMFLLDLKWTFCSRNGSFYATFSIETKDKGLQGPHSASATTIQPLKLAPPATQTFNLIKSPL